MACVQLGRDPRFTLEDCVDLALVLGNLSGEGVSPELEVLKGQVEGYKSVRVGSRRDCCLETRVCI